MEWGTRFLNKVGFRRKLAMPGDGSEHEPTIQQAIDNGHEVDFLYTGGLDKDPLRRTIIPTQIGDGPKGVRHIRAFSPEKSEYRTFRTDRIEKIFGTQPRSIEIPEDPEPLGSSGARPVQPVARPAQSVDATPSWVVTNPAAHYTKLEKTGDIEPTPEEYAEIRSLDIDPDTHDRAMVRRIRNLGATHLQIKNACEQGIPLEYYGDAFLIHNDHTKAIDTALKYQNHDDHIMSLCQQDRRESPDINERHRLSTEDHSQLVGRLMLHHLTLKNKEPGEFLPPYEPIPDRNRANEWIVNELAKVNPSLASKRGIDYKHDDTLLEPGAYDGIVNKLQKHHRLLLATAGTRKDYISQKRKMKALMHIGNSKFYPTDYFPNIYEED